MKRILKNLIFALIGAGLVVAGFYIGVYSSFHIFRTKEEKAVNELAKAMKQAQQEAYEKAMADTYGGKTPQETLKMFIEAVEKGDYELASRYFIESKQKEWKEGLIKSAQANQIKKLINLIEEAIPNLDKSYSEDIYIAEKPIYIELVIYPSGIWKLVDI